MQQPTTPMMPLMPSSFPPCNITTDQIQKYLDENKKLILAILENQNLGKLAECAQYQAQLQKNLMYLAAIADAQPQMATMPTQVSPQAAMQQGAYFMNPAMAQQQGVFPPRMPAQFAGALQSHEQQQQLHHQQAMPGQMNFRPTGPSNGMHPLQNEGSHRGGNSGPPPTSAVGSDVRGGNKQEGPERGSGGDGQGKSGMGGEGSEGGK